MPKTFFRISPSGSLAEPRWYSREGPEVKVETANDVVTAHRLPFLFRPALAPAKHNDNPVARKGWWLTWDECVIEFLNDHQGEIDRLPKPPRISVHGCAPYDCSYSYGLSRIGKRLRARTLEFSEALFSIQVGKSLYLFTGMLNSPFTSGRLHRFMTLLRAGIAYVTGNPKSALHPPVYAERHDKGFPLHADLFVTDNLWLIFDRVASGNSGQSLFLATKKLLQIIRGLSDFPAVMRERLNQILDRRSNKDSFDEFYALLYSSRHAWCDILASRLRQAHGKIKLDRGEGYLLNDRYWLHGRTSVNGYVSQSRFRRLVFGEVRPGWQERQVK